MDIRTADRQEEPSFKKGQLVWLRNKRFSKGKSQKLQPKYSGPYSVVEVGKNHTHVIEQHGRLSREAETRLKAYIPAQHEEGRAPNLVEPTRQLARPGMGTRGQPLATIPEEDEVWRDQIRKLLEKSVNADPSEVGNDSRQMDASITESEGTDSVAQQDDRRSVSPRTDDNSPSVTIRTPGQPEALEGVAHSTPLERWTPRQGVIPPTPQPSEVGVVPCGTPREDDQQSRGGASTHSEGVALIPSQSEIPQRPIRERRAPAWMGDYATVSIAE